MTWLKKITPVLVLLYIGGCASTPPAGPVSGSVAKQTYALPDKVQFLQTDKRWANQTIGGSYERLESDGCLVTAAAMAMVNLGFRTDPGDLTNRLKAYKGFTKNGWLVWSGLERATAGKLKTVFTDQTDDNTVRSCLAAGYYPLVKFDLPTRRAHWAMVVNETNNEFYVRDPMVSSRTPVPLKSRANGIDAIRCIGVSA